MPTPSIAGAVRRDEPVPLKEAVELFAGRMPIKVSTLRAAIGEGKLDYYKFGNAYCVTEDQFRDWMKTCLVKKNPQDFGSIDQEEPGQSSSKAKNTAQDAANSKLQKLKRNLGNSSKKDTAQPLAQVVPIRSNSQT